MALKQEVREYITKLAQTLGVDAAPMLTKAEADENAAKFIDESVMLRSDYSRKQDSLTKLQAEAQQKALDADSWYQTKWLPQWQQREAVLTATQNELNQYKAEAAAYKALYGDLEGFKPSAAAGGAGGGNAPSAAVASPANNPQYITREESAQLQATINKEMLWAADQHRDDLGKRLDWDAFEDFVVKGKYQGPKAIRQAYGDFVKPQLEAKSATERDLALAEAKKKGVEEYLAANPHIPSDPGAPAPRGSMIFRQPSKEDAAAAVLNDPNAPVFAKDQAMRDQFLRDMNGATLSGALAGR